MMARPAPPPPPHWAETALRWVPTAPPPPAFSSFPLGPAEEATPGWFGQFMAVAGTNYLIRVSYYKGATTLPAGPFTLRVGMQEPGVT
jgi:hypothetical protein